jgi:hypothetical protein
MKSGRTYRCPVCKKPLTKPEFDRALKFHEAQREQVLTLQNQITEIKRKSTAQERHIKLEARRVERQRTLRIVGNATREASKWKERFRLLQRGRTAQEYGPEFELTMLRRLRTEFRGDDIRPTPGGRGRDVLHVVKENGTVAGSIIYECKWSPRISGSHIRQAALAKTSRRAEFAVLVTSGSKRGFGGLAEKGGVLIVAPPCVLSMASLLRLHLIGLLRAGVERKHRAKVAHQLLNFIKSPEFKNPMEEVVRTAQALKEGVKEEHRWHVADWKKRLGAYERIRWDGFAVHENLRRVFQGEKPRPMLQPRGGPELPGMGSRSNPQRY